FPAGPDDRVDIGEDNVDAEVEEVDVTDGDDRVAGDDDAAIEQMIERLEQRQFFELFIHWRMCMAATGRSWPGSRLRRRSSMRGRRAVPATSIPRRDSAAR